MLHERLTVVLLLLAAPGAVRAASAFSGGDAPSAAALPADEQRAYLALILDEQEKDPVLVVMRGHDALISAADLRAAGLREIGGRHETLPDGEFVSLSSLAPDVTFRIDDEALAIRITAHPRLLDRSVIDLRQSSRPEGVTLVRDPAAFLNYSARVNSSGGLDGFAELGASLHGDLLSTGFSRFADGRTVRGLSSLTIDQPDHMVRLVAGDAVQPATALGGSGTLLGLTFQREYSLDPYFVRSPLPAASGFATTPSTLEVYVNGQMVRREAIAPGNFDVLNLPVTTGDGSYRTVVRDAFGRTSEISSRYYYSTGVLGKGLQDFSYSAGLQRREFGMASFSYGGPAFLGQHRYGLTDQLTGGGRLELAEGLANGGATVTTLLPAGELEARLVGSAGSHARGGAASLSYVYSAARVSTGALLRWQSPTYATLSLSPADDRALGQANLFVASPILPRFSLRGELQASRMRDAGDQLQLSLRADFQLGRRASLSLTAARVTGSPPTQLFAAFTWVFDPQTVGTGGVSPQSARMSVQRALGEGPGLGYLLAADQGAAGTSGMGLVQAQGAHGRVEAEYQRLGAQDAGSVSASGGLVLVGGNVFASRAVQEGFALLQVPGVEGVRGLLNNQIVGRTDRDGNLLIPNLIPYFANKLSIDPTDVPFDREVGRTEQLVASPHRGGGVVRFATPRIAAVEGVLVIETERGAVVPAAGELTAHTSEGERSSPIRPDGRFSLERMPPGTHPAQIITDDATCGLQLVVPHSSGIIDLGRVVCRRQAGIASR